MPANAGSTATTIRPATRATSLFTAEATPACWADAAAEGSGCQRRDGHREAQAEDHHRRQHLGEVIAVRGEADEQQHTGGDDAGADRHLQPRPDSYSERS